MLPLAAGAPNPWFGTAYISDYYEDILAALREHVVITIASVLFGLLLSIPLALIAQRSRVAEGLILGTAGVIYAIPSISLLLILYGSIGVAFLTFCATNRMFNEGGGLGVLAWLSLLGICSYGLYWVWQEYRSIG